MDERCRFQKIFVIRRQSFKILVSYLQFFSKVKEYLRRMRWVLVASTGFSRGVVAPFVANQGPCTESYNCLVRIDAGSQQGLCQHKGGCGCN